MKDQTSTTQNYQVQPTKWTFGFVLKLNIFATLAFAATIGYLIVTGHGLFWRPDGIPLHYGAYAYIGETLRDVVSSIAAGEIPHLTTYTFAQGYGADTQFTMGGNAMSLVNLTAVFFTPEVAEYGFYGTVWLRVVLMTLAFSTYCLHRGKSHGQALVGSMFYVLCGFSMFIGITGHAMFLDMGILLPLMFTGADRVFEGGRPTWLILSIGYTFFISAVYAYMLTLFLIAYCLIKYTFVPRQRSPYDFITLVGRFLLYGIVGFALGAVTGLPRVMHMLSLTRMKQGSVTPLFHDLEYYRYLLAQVVGTDISQNGLYLGIAAVLFIVVFILRGKHYEKREFIPWIVGLICCLIAICIPWFGHVINGFNYVTDRWMVLFGFVAAYIACLGVPVITKLKKSEWIAVALPVGAILCIAIVLAYPAYGWKVVVVGALYAFVVAAIMSASRGNPHTLPLVLALVVVFNGAVASTAHMSSFGGSSADAYVNRGAAYASLYKFNAAGAMDSYGIEDNVRFSSIGLYQVNGGLVARLPFISFFASLYSQPIDDFRDGLGIQTNHTSFVYCGNMGRFAVDAFSGAKYDVAAHGESAWLAPYSYKKVVDTDNGYTIYETDNALPLAFAYDTTIARSDYNALNMVEKQEALLQGCIVEDAENIGAAKTKVKAASEEIVYTVEPDAGVTVNGTTVTTTKADTGFTLRFEGLDASETYVCLENPWFKYKKAANYSATFTSGERRVFTEFDTPLHRTYKPSSGVAANLGYSKDALNEIHVSLNWAGTYTFDAIKVICQPVKPIEENLKALKKTGADKVNLKQGQVSAHFADMKAGSLALFTVPYSSGWSATIDGKPARVLQADVGFCAVEVTQAGEHTIELSYTTPWQRLGIVITLLGFAAFVAIQIIYSIQKRKTLAASSIPAGLRDEQKLSQQVPAVNQKETATVLSEQATTPELTAVSIEQAQDTTPVPNARTGRGKHAR